MLRTGKIGRGRLDKGIAQKEWAAAGCKMSLAAVKKDMLHRDKTDYNRTEGPLKPARDAIRLDTSLLTIEATIDKMLAIVESNPLKDGKLAVSRA